MGTLAGVSSANLTGDEVPRRLPVVFLLAAAVLTALYGLWASKLATLPES